VTKPVAELAAGDEARRAIAGYPRAGDKAQTGLTTRLRTRLVDALGERAMRPIPRPSSAPPFPPPAPTSGAAAPLGHRRHHRPGATAEDTGGSMILRRKEDRGVTAAHPQSSCYRAAKSPDSRYVSLSWVRMRARTSQLGPGRLRTLWRQRLAAHRPARHTAHRDHRRPGCHRHDKAQRFARHASPVTTQVYDHRNKTLDDHPSYALAAWFAEACWPPAQATGPSPPPLL